ncbi:MAG: hypothetical protein KTR31_03295 [Myxococcales bacterium]|nr:hypothetical protein [Myxococcales bacterium]
MGDVLVRRGTVEDGRIAELVVDFHGLPKRTIDRDTALSWMRDGHSLVPVRAGVRLTALQLVEDPEGALWIRTDNAPTGEDSLPDIPPA